MDERLTAEQLARLASELKNDLSLKAVQSSVANPALQFGAIWMGGVPEFSQGKPHPLVIVEEYLGPAPAFLSLRPSTSQPDKRPTVLRLPARAIHSKKEGKYVPSYVLCFRRLHQPTANIKKMQFLNILDPCHHASLRGCLKKCLGASCA